MRRDLGGYGANSAVADVDVARPFVLFCGPNGSGKSATLRMIRNSLGLSGERVGTLEGGGLGQRSPPASECGGDLGKLAAFRTTFGGRGVEMPKDSAGVLDVEALGWRGQRTWLFDSRVETVRLNASTFESDIQDHVFAIMAGRQSSHGEALRRAWSNLMDWSVGEMDARDPYDDVAALPEANKTLFGKLVPKGERATERWLLLDEPETAVDAEAFVAGMSLLVHHAEVGRLRVFCASHSPVFAAGLADNPNVQVVDMGGRVQWMTGQRRMLEVARDPAAVSSIGANVLKRVLAHGERLRAAQEKEKAERTRSLVGSLSAATKRTLSRCLAAPDGLHPPGKSSISHRRTFRSVNFGVRDKDLLVWVQDKGTFTLTETGREVAELVANAPVRKGKAHEVRHLPTSSS